MAQSWIPHNDNLISKIPLTMDIDKLLAEFLVLRESDEQELDPGIGGEKGILKLVRNAGMVEIARPMTLAYQIHSETNRLDIPDCLPELQKTVKKLLVYLNFELTHPEIMYAIIKPNGLYRWHIDQNPQLNKTNKVFHIPLVSNDGCWMVFENTTFHLPADGSVYKVNNGVYHTYINAGPTERIHLLING